MEHLGNFVVTLFHFLPKRDESEQMMELSVLSEYP